MPAQEHLWRRNGVYYFRMKFPPRIAAAGITFAVDGREQRLEIKFSLKTSEREENSKTSDQSRLVFFGQIVLPYSQHMPASFPQSASNLSVAFPIASDFFLPECLVLFGPSAVDRATVPETAVHKNNEAEFSKNEIRTSQNGLVPPPARYVVQPE